MSAMSSASVGSPSHGVARSTSGSTAVQPSRAPPASNQVVTVVASARIASNSSALAAWATTVVAPLWLARYNRSFARSCSALGTATAPIRSAATMQNSHSGIFGSTTTTRSPLRTPASRSTAAQRRDASAI